MTAIAMVAQAIQHEQSLWNPFLQLGIAGACLVALAIYYIRKDLRYEKRIDEMREMEKAFRAEQADQQKTFRTEQAVMAEKYRAALEKVSQTLDTIVILLKGQK